MYFLHFSPPLLPSLPLLFLLISSAITICQAGLIVNGPFYTTVNDTLTLNLSYTNTNGSEINSSFVPTSYELVLISNRLQQEILNLIRPKTTVKDKERKLGLLERMAYGITRKILDESSLSTPQSRQLSQYLFQKSVALESKEYENEDLYSLERYKSQIQSDLLRTRQPTSYDYDYSIAQDYVKYVRCLLKAESDVDLAISAIKQTYQQREFHEIRWEQESEERANVERPSIDDDDDEIEEALVKHRSVLQCLVDHLCNPWN